MSAVVSASLVSFLLLATGGLISPTPIAFAQEAPAPAAVTLPDSKLPDPEYKAALAMLLNDSMQRPGTYKALLLTVQATRRQPIPPHAQVIAELLTERLDSANLLETIQPLRLLGRCGAVSQPALPKVLKLADSKIAPVRAAAVEALGGMYAVWEGGTSTSPAEVREVLLRSIQAEKDRSTRRAASVALGRARIADTEVVTALAAVAGADDTPVALGALNAAENLGPKAELMLPAITKSLSDSRRVNNAAPALLSVASPQEAINRIAQTLTATDNFTVRQTLLYYSEIMPVKKGGANIIPLINAIKPLMEPLPLPAAATPATTEPVTNDATGTQETPAPQPTNDEEEPEYAPTAEDMTVLRVTAARTYAHLSGDASTAATALSTIVGDTAQPPAARTQAIIALSKLGPTIAKSPVVINTLTTALTDPDAGVQNAATQTISRLTGPAAAAAAPRLSELLLTAWKNKENARVQTLINALYRIGPPAAKYATPVFKTILAKEPKNSTNARYAQLALQRMRTK